MPTPQPRRHATPLPLRYHTIDSTLHTISSTLHTISSTRHTFSSTLHTINSMPLIRTCLSIVLDGALVEVCRPILPTGKVFAVLHILLAIH